MKTVLRRHRLLLVSLLLGLCAFVSSYSVLKGYVKSATVVVALRDVDAYVEIGPGDVRLLEVPVGGIPRGAVTALSEAIGYYARGRLVAGQTIMAGHLIGGQEGAGLSYDLPEDKRGMFLPVPAARAVGGLVRRGERVDVIVAYSNGAMGYGQPGAVAAFTALRDLLVTEVVVDADSKEFLGVVVHAGRGDCEEMAGHLEDANLYLTLVPRGSTFLETQPEVWPQK